MIAIELRHLCNDTSTYDEVSESISEVFEKCFLHRSTIFLSEIHRSHVLGNNRKIPTLKSLDRRVVTVMNNFIRLRSSFASVIVLWWSQAAFAAPTTTYIGTLPAEPPARIAIVVEGDQYLAYACGQTDDFNRSASAWFKGRLESNSIAAKADDKTLSAEFKEGRFRGTLTIEGRTREFTAKPVATNAIAGLYRATHETADDKVVVGWIVDAKNLVVGGCQSSKRPPVALPSKKVNPPKIKNDEQPEPKQEAEELLVQQVDEESNVAVQGEKVKSVANPPKGKLLVANKKKK
jgi:hypothetical protein